MTDYVLVLNAGSSSLKFAVYAATRTAGLRGARPGRGHRHAPKFSAKDAAGEARRGKLGPEVRDARGARGARRLAQEAFPDATLVGVGHRVVHGGSRCTRRRRS